jgi:hypothetical protein
MSISTDVTHQNKEYQDIGKTRGCENHDHDLVHELSRRLDGVWRYDQYIANADGMTDLLEFWHAIKQQEQENIASLKRFISQHIKSHCF